MAALFIRLILLLCCQILNVLASEISGISFSGLTYTPLSSLRYPHEGWSASFDFSIDSSQSVYKDDYFSLVFPTVYRVEFDKNEPTTNVTLQDGTKAFQCFAAQQAAYKYDETILKCVALEDLSSYSSLAGSISFGLSFSSGGSAYEYEMQNADRFASGTNEVSLADQLSASIQFDSANFSEGLFTIARTTTYNSLESYYLGMSCPSGFLLGGTQTINYDRENAGHDLDCSSAQVYLSDKFNDWSLPLSSDNANAQYGCSGDILNITIGQADTDQKLWINALQEVSEGVNTVQHEVYLHYSCSNTAENTVYETQFSTVVEYTIYQASDSGAMSGLSVTPTTATSVSSSSITTPTITSTSTTGWTGTYNTTYSTGSTEWSGSAGVPTEEIIYYVETPSTAEIDITTTTTTTGWTGTYVTTYSTGSTEWSGSAGVPTEEIIYYVETPSTAEIGITTTTTTTTGWTGTYNTTYSTGSTEWSGSTGVPTEEIIYYVETPSTAEIDITTTTTTTGWTGTYVTTYSTGSTEWSGSAGVPTEEIIYYVETPSTAEIGITTTTTTTGWTGTYVTTYSTGSTEWSGSAGVPTEEIIYYVETPSTAEIGITTTTTTTTGWTGTYNTTYSTGSTEWSGSTGVPTEEIIYYVETPSTAEIDITTTTTTTGWTGTYVTTYSTGSTEWSGSTGVPTEEIIYYVETPSTAENTETQANNTTSPSSSLSFVPSTTGYVTTVTTTTVTPWTGTYESTYSTGTTSFSSNGTNLVTKEVVYYVETPFFGQNTHSSMSFPSLVSSTRSNFNVSATTPAPFSTTLLTSEFSSIVATTCDCTYPSPASNKTTLIDSESSRESYTSTSPLSRSTSSDIQNSETASNSNYMSSAGSSLLSQTFNTSSYSNVPSTAVSPSPAAGSSINLTTTKSTTNSTVVPSSSYPSTSDSSRLVVASGPTASLEPSKTFSGSIPVSEASYSSPPTSSVGPSLSNAIDSRYTELFSSSTFILSEVAPLSSFLTSTDLASFTVASSSNSTPTRVLSAGTSKTAVSTQSTDTNDKISSSQARFSLGFSLDQGSIAPVSSLPSTNTLYTSTFTAVAIVTVTSSSTTTTAVTASVTQTITPQLSGCAANVFQSSLLSSFTSATTTNSASLAPFSAQGLLLRPASTITALLGALIFIL